MDSIENEHCASIPDSCFVSFFPGYGTLLFITRVFGCNLSLEGVLAIRPAVNFHPQALKTLEPLQCCAAEVGFEHAFGLQLKLYAFHLKTTVLLLFLIDSAMFPSLDPPS